MQQRSTSFAFQATPPSSVAKDAHPQRHRRVVSSISFSPTKSASISSTDSRHSEMSNSRHVLACLDPGATPFRGGKFIHNVQLKKRNRLINFTIVGYIQPSSYFSIEITAAGGLAGGEQSKTVFVNVTQEFDDLLRLWSILSCYKENINNRIAQRLIKSMKIVFDDSDLLHVSMDYKTFSSKNRVESMELLTMMATRIQAAARRFLIQRRPRQSSHFLPSPQIRENDISSTQKRSKSRQSSRQRKGRRMELLSSSNKGPKKSKFNSTPNRNKSKRAGPVRRDERRSPHQPSNSPAQKELFMTTSSIDDDMQHRYDYDIDTINNFPMYEPNKLVSRYDGKGAVTLRSKSAHSDMNNTRRKQSHYTRSATMSAHHVVGRQSPQKRNKEDFDSSFPSLSNNNNNPAKLKLLSEIRSIKEEMSIALESFQSEMEIVRNGLNDEKEKSGATNIAFDGSQVHVPSDYTFSKMESSLEAPDSVDDMRLELLSAKEEIQNLRSQLSSSFVNRSETSAQEEEAMEVASSQLLADDFPVNSLSDEDLQVGRKLETADDSLLLNNIAEDSVKVEAFTEDHERAACSIQKAFREVAKKASTRSRLEVFICNLQEKREVSYKDALQEACETGNAVLAELVIQRVFENYQDFKTVRGLSFTNKVEISLMCRVISSFISIKNVVLFGVQLLSLVSLVDEKRDSCKCIELLISSRTCELVMDALCRHTGDDDICACALSLAHRLTSSKSATYLLFSSQKYCQGILDVMQCHPLNLAITEKSMRLLVKSTHEAPDVVNRFSFVSNQLCDLMFDGYYRHMRSGMFYLYCRGIANFCCHKNMSLKKLFSSRKWSNAYIDGLFVYQTDEKCFQMLSDIISFLCESEALLDILLSEYFVSALTNITSLSALPCEVVDEMVTLLHNLCSSHDYFLKALRETSIDASLTLILGKHHNRKSLCWRIKLLQSMMGKGMKRTESASSFILSKDGCASKDTLEADLESNFLLPRHSMLQEIHECSNAEDLIEYFRYARRECRDSIALQSLVRLTFLLSDEGDHSAMVSTLIENIQVLVDTVKAFVASVDVVVASIDLLQLVSIYHGSQCSDVDMLNFYKIVHHFICDYYLSLNVCEKYLDFVMQLTNQNSSVARRAAGAESFAIIKNIISRHSSQKQIFLKSCRCIVQVAKSREQKTMVLAAGVNDCITNYVKKISFDGDVANGFCETAEFLCDSAPDQLLFFSSQNCCSLYLHLLQSCSLSNDTWNPLLRVLLLFCESQKEEYLRALQATNFSTVVSQALLTFNPIVESSFLLVESVLMFLLGMLNASPSLEQSFVSAEGSSIIFAISSIDDSDSSSLSSIINASKAISGQLRTAHQVEPMEKLAQSFLQSLQTESVARRDAVETLQRNARHWIRLKNVTRSVSAMKAAISNKILDYDIINKCLLVSVETGNVELCQMTLNKVVGLLQSDQNKAKDCLLHLAAASGTIFLVISSFLSILSLQLDLLKILRCLPFAPQSEVVSTQWKMHLDTLYLSMLRHIDERSLCLEGLETLTNLTRLSESIIYSSSSPLCFRVMTQVFERWNGDKDMMLLICQFVFNMCQNIENHERFESCNAPACLITFLAKHLHSNEVVNQAAIAISSLCANGHIGNMEVLANSMSLTLYFTILRRNRKNVGIHVSIGKMLVSLSSGLIKRDLVEPELSKIGIAQEILDLLTSALAANRTVIASCCVALATHFICHFSSLRHPFMLLGMNVTLFEFIKPKWSDAVKYTADIALCHLGETRHRSKFSLQNVLFKKNSTRSFNYFEIIHQIREESVLRRMRGTASAASEKRERDLREKLKQFDFFASMPDSMLASAWLTTGQLSEEAAASTIIRAVRTYLSNKAARVKREEERKRLPVLKQLADITNDATILQECFVMSTKWGHQDLGLVSTRRLLTLLRNGANDSVLEWVKELTKDPSIVFEILHTFMRNQEIVKQVLLLFQMLAFESHQVKLLADMGCSETILSLMLRHPLSLEICKESIDTLAYFAEICPSFRYNLCEERTIKVVLYALEKRQAYDVIVTACFRLVSNTCRGVVEAQEMYSLSKLSLHIFQFASGNLHDRAAAGVVCRVVRSLCEDGVLSNLQQYYSRKFLAIYHGWLVCHLSNMSIVGDICSLLKLAARRSGPYAVYFAEELSQCRAAEFLIRVLRPEQEYRQCQSVFVSLLSILGIYLRLIPSIIPSLLEADAIAMMQQYLTSEWSDEVHRIVGQCIEKLEGKDVEIDDLSSEHDSMSRNISKSDAVSVVTQEGDKSEDVGALVEEQTSDENETFSVRLASTENDLDKSFGFLRSSIKDMQLESSEIVRILSNISQMLKAATPQELLRTAELNSDEVNQRICEEYPYTLRLCLETFCWEKPVQRDVFRILRSFPCDDISPAVAEFGRSLMQSIQMFLQHSGFCLRMMHFALHFISESVAMRRQMLSKECIEIFLNVIEKYLGNVELSMVCLRCVHALQLCEEEFQSALCDDRAGALLVKLVEQHKFDKDVLSLSARVIVTFCLAEESVSARTLGSPASMRTYIAIIAANPTNEYICNSMVFILLGVLTLSSDQFKNPSEVGLFCQDIVQTLTASNLSEKVAEIMVTFASKIIFNFSELGRVMYEAGIAECLADYCNNESRSFTTRSIATMTLDKLLKLFSINVDDDQEEESSTIDSCVEDKSEERMIANSDDFPEDTSVAEGSASPLSDHLQESDLPDVVNGLISLDEATRRVSSFISKCISQKRLQKQQSTLRDIERSGRFDTKPLHEVMDLIVSTGRIHVAVTIIKKILIGVQNSNDKSGMASLLAAQPKPLVSLLNAFLSIESVTRDGLVILRSLSIKGEEEKESIANCDVIGLLYVIIRRYSKSNLSLSSSALKTMAVLAKGNAYIQNTLTSAISSGLIDELHKHSTAMQLVLDGLFAVNNLCKNCHKNCLLFCTESFCTLSLQFLNTFRLDDDCVRAVGQLLKSLCKSSEECIRLYSTRERLTLLFEILKLHMSREDIVDIYCTAFTLMSGDGSESITEELTASGACVTLAAIIRNEESYRVSPKLLSPILSLMVHYVYNIPLISLEMYRSDMLECLEPYQDSSTWNPIDSTIRQAADIVSAKIKLDVKRRDDARKKALRKAAKLTHAAVKLSRQTSLPAEGIKDWKSIEQLEALLQKAIELDNEEDVLIVLNRIVEVARSSDFNGAELKGRYHFLEAVKNAMQTFTVQSIQLAGVSVMESLLPEVLDEHEDSSGVSLGSFFLDSLSLHAEDEILSCRLMTTMINLSTGVPSIRKQLTTLDAMTVLVRVISEHGKHNLQLLELSLLFVCKISQQCNHQSRSLFAQSGLSAALLSVLIDQMDKKEFVSLISETIPHLCCDENSENLPVFASPSSMKVYLHIIRSFADREDNASDLKGLLIALLTALDRSKSPQADKLAKSSFVQDLCSLIKDQMQDPNGFHKKIRECVLQLGKFVATEVVFLHEKALGSGLIRLLYSYQDNSLDANLLAGIKSRLAGAQE